MGPRFALHSHCWRTTRMNIKLTSRVTQFLALLCILNMILAGCSSSPSPVEQSQHCPRHQRPAHTGQPKLGAPRPEEQGMDSHKLAQMLIAIQQQHLNLHSLLVIRNGYLVSETYFGPYQQDTRHELYSCTKSFISTLIGIAVDKAYIDRTDHRIVDFFSERTFTNLDRQKADMTLEDVLTMRSGLDWQEGARSIERCIKAWIGSSSCSISRWPYRLGAGSTIVRDARICYPPLSSKRRA